MKRILGHLTGGVIGTTSGQATQAEPAANELGPTPAADAPGANPVSESAVASTPETAEQYWTRHNITLHHVFASVEESLNFIEWRNLQHPYYAELMPVGGWNGKTVLDYGCGPGHDLIGFAEQNHQLRLIGMDVSPTSLAETELRLGLHGKEAELVRIGENDPQLPLPDGSIDVIHSSGVLHHTPDPERIMREFARVLKPDGVAQIMVYNCDSVWMHIYVAYQRMLVEGLSAGKSLREAFTASTDGPDCPISECYAPDEFLAMAQRAGLRGKLRGVAISSWEMKWFAHRWDALLDKRLPSESRRFIYELTLDERGIPCYRGNVAGVDACFELRTG